MIKRILHFNYLDEEKARKCNEDEKVMGFYPYDGDAGRDS